MSRLMSVTLTTQAVIERKKTVTRRLGWTFLKPGDRLTLCRKVQGRRRKDGTVEPLERLAEVEVVAVERGPLGFALTADEMAREGVDPALYDAAWLPRGTAGHRWVSWYCEEMGVTPDTEVTRIEFKYLEAE